MMRGDIQNVVTTISEIGRNDSLPINDGINLCSSFFFPQFRNSENMGKGGQSSIKKQVKASKLSHLPDAELRKWACDYGVKEEATREALLESLVIYIPSIHK